MVRGKARDVNELSWISPGCIQCCAFLYGGGRDDATQSGDILLWQQRPLKSAEP